MNKEDFDKLHAGDIVKSSLTGSVYVVTGNYGQRCTAVRSVDLTNPSEWELVAKVKKPGGQDQDE